MGGAERMDLLMHIGVTSRPNGLLRNVGQQVRNAIGMAKELPSFIRRASRLAVMETIASRRASNREGMPVLRNSLSFQSATSSSSGLLTPSTGLRPSFFSSRSSVGGFFSSPAPAMNSNHKRASLGNFGGVHSRSSGVGVIDEDDDFDCFGEEKVAEMSAEPMPIISVQPVHTSPRRTALENNLSPVGVSHRRATATPSSSSS